MPLTPPRQSGPTVRDTIYEVAARRIGKTAMKRRDILKSALLGTGAAVSGTAAGHSHTSVAPVSAASAAAAASASEAGKPLLFDAHQSETVTMLSDLIIPATDTPGAKQAGVTAYIDLILNDGEAAAREEFLSGLGWLDGYALRQHKQPFARLSADEQVALLKTLDDTKLPDLKTGARFFKQVKQLTVEGYYTSKIGIDELNKHGVPDTYV